MDRGGSSYGYASHIATPDRYGRRYNSSVGSGYKGSSYGGGGGGGGGVGNGGGAPGSSSARRGAGGSRLLLGTGSADSPVARAGGASYFSGGDPRSPRGDGGVYGNSFRSPDRRGSRDGGVMPGSGRRGGLAGDYTRGSSTGGYGGAGGAYGSGTGGAALRQRARRSGTPMIASDVPPTASYDDDDDDLGEAPGLGGFGASAATPARTPYATPARAGRDAPGHLMAGGGAGVGVDTVGSVLLNGHHNGFGGDLAQLEGHGLAVRDTAAAAAGLGNVNDAVYGDRRWVTVFGFRPGTANAVLRHFQDLGTIIAQRVSTSNWMHIQYETQLQAQAALGKNGHVHSSYMLGVVRCTDPAAFDDSADFGTKLSTGHHRLGGGSGGAKSNGRLDTDGVFKPRRRRKSVCSQLCEYMCKWSW